MTTTRANDYPTLSQDQLDAIVAVMDDDIREELHTAEDWQHPGEFLTAYMARVPDFPLHQFATATDSDDDEATEHEDASDLVLCESPDGWSLHAPGSTDAQIADGDAPYLVSGAGEPTPADYAEALRVLRTRSE